MLRSLGILVVEVVPMLRIEVAVQRDVMVPLEARASEASPWQIKHTGVRAHTCDDDLGFEVCLLQPPDRLGQLKQRVSAPHIEPEASMSARTL